VPPPSLFFRVRIFSMPQPLSALLGAAPALRSALNARPWGSPGLRFVPGRPEEKKRNKKQKGDTSNEVTKGTFLTSFDTIFDRIDSP
jgi:hypothetical protein